MSETLRKFGSEDPSMETLCADCRLPWGRHSGWFCPNNLPLLELPKATPTEMTSLREIRAALARTEENQGKLLAALNELQGSGPAWTQGFTTAQEQINKEVAGLLTTIKGSLDCIGGVLAELLAAKPPRRKSSRRKEGGRK